MQVLGVESYTDGSGGQSGPNGGRSGSFLMAHKPRTCGPAFREVSARWTSTA